MGKKYYSLKLKRDFFKRHDIKIVESMENGKDYLLFYMKLLVESIDHDGALRFSYTLPYNDKMLASITDTNIDIVRSAIKVFAELGMIDIMDDGTLFMSQVITMIGDETEWKKKRTYRIKAKDKPLEIEGQKRTLSDKSLELDIDIDNTVHAVPATSVKEPKEPSPESTRLSSLLLELHQRIDDGFTRNVAQLATWAQDIDKINRLDGRSWKDIEAVMRWAKADDFWASNIISGAKLRKQFSTLTARMKGCKLKPEPIETPNYIPDPEIDAIFERAK